MWQRWIYPLDSGEGMSCSIPSLWPWACPLLVVPQLLLRRFLDHVRIDFHPLTPGKAHVRMQVLLREWKTCSEWFQGKALNVSAGVTLNPDTNLSFLKSLFLFAVDKTGTGWRQVMLQDCNFRVFVKIFKVWTFVFILLGLFFFSFSYFQLCLY